MTKTERFDTCKLVNNGGKWVTREREREISGNRKRNSINQAQRNTLYLALFIKHNYNTSRIF